MAGNAKVLPAVLVIAVLGLGCVQQRIYSAKDIYERGLTEYYAGNYTSAAGDFQWAMQIKKEYSGPMIGLAQCHLQFARENYVRKNTTAAIQDLIEARYWIDHALDADPGNPDAPRVRTDIQRLRGEVDQTIKTSTWAQNTQGPNLHNLLLKAQTYLENGAYDEAEVAYKQAVAVAPGSVEARIEAGKFYEKIGKRDLALQQYEEAFRIDSANPDVQSNITRLTGSVPQAPTGGEENP